MKAVTIGATSLKRVLRDRTALFFIVALPVLIILVIGTVTSSFAGFRVAVVDLDRSGLSGRLVSAVTEEQTIDVTIAGAEKATKALRRSELDAVIVIPDGYERELSASGTSTVTILGERTNESQRAARTALESIIATEGALLQAGQFMEATAGGDLTSRLAMVEAVNQELDGVAVEVSTVDAVSTSLPAGYTYSAPTMLVLFVFITSLAAGAAIIQSRDLRLYERMRAGPVGSAAIIEGETLAYFALAMLQSILIVAVGAVFFGVGWGSVWSSAALVAVWALVGTGAGMLSGTLFRTPEQAGSIGPAIGIALGMLGGCMWPLEIVPPVMRTIGHVVPHGWAVDAWTQVIGEGVGVGGIATELVVLAVYAATMIAAATLRLRRVLLS